MKNLKIYLSRKKIMKILITGGAGYKGTVLVNKLLSNRKIKNYCS